MGFALEGALIDFFDRTCPGRAVFDLVLGALMLGAVDRGLLEIEGRKLLDLASSIVSYVPGWKTPSSPSSPLGSVLSWLGRISSR
jgi:hypothetical protein